MTKERIDNLLVNLKLCESRTYAQKIIRAGEVKVNGHIIDKPGTQIDTNLKIELLEKPPFVSRGGEKLQKALKEFEINVEGRICLDGGISTGGFTDCLLQAGAKLVYGIDVGYGQVAWKLRQDSRLILKERTNFRYLTSESLYGNNNNKTKSPIADLAVMDLSFISLTKVLETLWNLLALPKEIVLLIKPQFEVGRARIGKKGVVRDSSYQAQAILKILIEANQLGWQYCDLTWSPLRGPAGNIEYLLWMNSHSEKTLPKLEDIEQISKSAFSYFS